MSTIDAPEERRATPEERIDLDAGWGPLNLSQRRREYEAGRGGAWAMTLESLLRGISSLR